MSASIVTHLRWDLRHIFRMAIAELARAQPGRIVVHSSSAKSAAQRVATAEEVGQVFAALDLRERLILKLAGIAGLRPGEILGLKWVNLEAPHANIRQRVYRGVIDSPKSPKSIRRAALSGTLLTDVSEWRALCVNTNPEAWVFPSERDTPLRKDNVWRRIGPKLAAVGLGWVNFQVLRRSCSSLMSIRESMER